MNQISRLSLLAVCTPFAVFAQTTAPDPAPANTPQSSDQGGLAEIVVTANKREENIEKVGISIAAISGADLQERRITSLEDVAAAVPGLSFAESANETPIFTLRGVGFNESSLGVYPAVSVYVDQIPLPFPALQAHSAYDLQQIEVLKGPQGTLFGQNSTGGAVNYIAAKPTNDFAAGADLSFGRFNETDMNAYVSGPLSDTVQARVALTAHHMDDWQYSVTRPGDTNGHQSYIAGRGLLDWEPTSAVRISLNFNGWNDTSQPQAWQMIGVRTQNPAYEPLAFPTTTFVQNNARAADWTVQFADPARGGALNDIAPFGNKSFEQGALRVDVDITQDITLTSLTSYNVYSQTQSIDNDGTALVIENFPELDGGIHSFNQEVRLANSSKDRFRWILGANLEHSITNEEQDNRYLHTSYYDPTDMMINASVVENEQKIRNYAFFNSSEFSLTDQLTLVGGVRFTDSSNKDYICGSTIPGGNVNNLFNVLGTALGKVPFTPLTPSSCYTLNANNVPGQAFTDTLNENNTSWKGGVNYQLNQDALLYLTVSKGFKAGNFPTLAAATYAALQPVTQESVTAYETGLKTQFFDRRVTFDAAGFYYNYKNKQVLGKLADPVFGALEALVNVPKSRIFGAEAEVSVAPFTGFTVSADLTYLNSKIQQYSGINYLGQPNFNSAGDPLPFTPSWSSSVNADYRFHVGGGTPFVGVSANYRSEQDAAISAQRLDYFNEANVSLRPGIGCVYCISGYATVDARIGYESQDARWTATLWGKNILNKYYWTNVIAAYDDSARIAGMPATFGVSIAFKFN